MKYAKRTGKSLGDIITHGKIYEVDSHEDNCLIIKDDHGDAWCFSEGNMKWSVFDIPDASECLNTVVINPSTTKFIDHIVNDVHLRHEPFFNAIGIGFNYRGSVQANSGVSEDEIRKVLRIPKDMDVIKFCKALRMMADSWIDATK